MRKKLWFRVAIKFQPDIIRVVKSGKLLFAIMVGFYAAMFYSCLFQLRFKRS